MFSIQSVAQLAAQLAASFLPATAAPEVVAVVTLLGTLANEGRGATESEAAAVVTPLKSALSTISSTTAAVTSSLGTVAPAASTLAVTIATATPIETASPTDQTAVPAAA